MTLERQLRILESIPESEFDNYISSLNLPSQHLLFGEKDHLAIINNKFHEMIALLTENEDEPKPVLMSIKNATHVAFLGVFSVDSRND
ncbi:MAG: hypothetical protein ACTSPV_16780 [Candidatus Hodarchaeales archaeon]